MVISAGRIAHKLSSLPQRSPFPPHPATAGRLMVEPDGRKAP